MNYQKRIVESAIGRILDRGKSVLLLGPRQTGKTTMLGQFSTDLSVTLAKSDVRRSYQSNPSRIRDEVMAIGKPYANALRETPLVVLDEIQKVPEVMDDTQSLIDDRQASFIFTGSSARKLRKAGVNLLPGRVVQLRMDSLSAEENPNIPLMEHLLYGSMPGIVADKDDFSRQEDLESYIETYLNEEIQAEAIVRNLGTFSRFLELAAAESGLITNLRELSGKIGVSHPTVAGYYKILEDCLIIERIEPLSSSAVRKRLTKSPRHLFFDLGVRRIAAREGVNPPASVMGFWFEQFVGLEILRYIRSHTIHLARLTFWRDPDGPEVDWVIDDSGTFVPVEVKWTDTPTLGDAKHLLTFMDEYPTHGTGYVVCRAPNAMKLSDKITALPWNCFMKRIASDIGWKKE